MSTFKLPSTGQLRLVTLDRSTFAVKAAIAFSIAQDQVET